MSPRIIDSVLQRKRTRPAQTEVDNLDTRVGSIDDPFGNSVECT